jgi:hypothetical protein
MKDESKNKVKENKKKDATDKGEDDGFLLCQKCLQFNKLSR